MKYSFFIVLITCVSILTSCYSSKEIIDNTKYRPQRHTFNDSTFTYPNTIDSTRTTLWSILKGNKVVTSNIPQGNMVTIRVIDSSNIEAKLYDNKMLMDSLEFKGTVIENMFHVKRKAIYIPFLIINYFYDRKLLIGFSGEKEIILKQGSYYHFNLAFYGATNAEIEEFKVPPITKHSPRAPM